MAGRCAFGWELRTSDAFAQAHPEIERCRAARALAQMAATRKNINANKQAGASWPGGM
jgi:hypothetical protein